MAYIKGKPQAWYEVAARVVRSAFVTRDSLFTPGLRLWTDANVADFESRYVGRPDEGEGNHSQKLQDQFADATPEQWQFAAELLYLHYLPFYVMIKPETKRARVREMLSHTEVTMPPDLDAALETGIANPGPANQHRYWQIAYLAKLLGAWWRLPQGERDAAMADPDAFKRICASVSMQASDTQRHALLYMAFPAVFEPIVSGNTKRRVAEQLADGDERAIADLDERLRRIRDRLTPEFGEDFNFFADAVKARWSAPTEKADDDQGWAAPEMSEEAAADDQSVAQHIAILARYPAAQNFGTLPDQEKADFKRARSAVKRIVEQTTAITLGKLATRSVTSILNPSGRTTDHYWACAFPLAVPHKSYGLQLAVILSPRGVEMCCCLGSGASETKTPDQQRELTEALSAAKRKLARLPDETRSRMLARLTGDWHLRRQWRQSPAEADEFGTFDEWLSYAGGPASVGASISRYFLPDAIPSLDRLQREFRRAAEIFGPLFDALYSLNEVAQITLHSEDLSSEEEESGDAARYWRMSAGSNAEEWPHWRDEGYIAIGWADFGDLTGVTDDEFDARQAAIAQAKNDPTFVNGGSNQVYRFALQMKAGDWVVINHGFHSIVGIGQITGDYYFENDGRGREHRRTVRWTDLAKRPCPKKWRSSLGGIDRTLFERIVASGPSSDPLATAGADTAAMKDITYAPDDVPLDRLNTIYYGPPGTGKTRAALLVVDEWAKRYGRDAVEQVTFHPSYGYEDFIEGFRPDENGRFTLRDGVLKRLAARASADRRRPYLLLVDEINRGDVARIFGELITLIEPDKRGRACTLPYSLKPLVIPSNLYLLGTMNTADRSVSLMDLAFRRRFSFEAFLPDPTILDDGPEVGPYCTAFQGVSLASVMRSVNATLLGLGIDADRSIGHSYFLVARCEADDEAFARLSEAFQYSILPLVEEYCFAMRGRISEVLGALVNETGVAQRAVFDDPERFADALRTIAKRAKTDE